MHWRVKGIIQKALSVVPGGFRVNSALQRTIGKRIRVEDVVDSKVRDDFVVLMDYKRELGIDPKGLVYLELGTGWQPILPACYALAGARRIHTFDLHRHLEPSYSVAMLKHLGTHLETIASASGRSLAEVTAHHQRLCAAGSIDDLLREAAIDYRAPADARATGLPDASIDVYFSNSVLEHIPEQVIVDIFRESARVLRPGGVALHAVNCGDHYAHFDRSITQLNYLSYSDQAWRLWNNSIQFQNRLRPRDFVAMARSAGLEIVLHHQRARPEMLERLSRMKVAPEFLQYPPEELAATSLGFAARRPGG